MTTIIILIILAGISISMILGNEGLLNKAKYAKESYSNAQQKEGIDIAKYSNDINGYVSGNRDYDIEIENLKAEIKNLKSFLNFSNEEKEIGTWVDENSVTKTLYQKSYSIANIKNNDVLDNTLNKNNIIIRNLYGNLTCNEKTFYINTGGAWGASWYYDIRLGENNMYFHSSASYDFINFNLTIQYTKNNE